MQSVIVYIDDADHARAVLAPLVARAGAAPCRWIVVASGTAAVGLDIELVRRMDPADCAPGLSQRDRALAAESLDLTLLQDAQQLGLQRQAHLGDLVQEQRTALGLLELPRRGSVGPREGALLVAEEHRLEHVVRYRGAVDGDEGTGGPARLAVNEARQHLLAGPALPAEKHRRVALRDPRRQREQGAARRVLGDDLGVRPGDRPQVLGHLGDEDLGLSPLNQRQPCI